MKRWEHTYRWRAQFTAANKQHGSAWWQGMARGRKRFNERRTLARDARRDVLWGYLQTGRAMPWGWQTQIAREWNISRQTISSDIRALLGQVPLAAGIRSTSKG
jgi:hypothetical protein